MGKSPSLPVAESQTVEFARKWARGQLVPEAARSFGENGVSMMLMMHTASEMLRAMSPVAGVIIVVAGFAKVNPLAMVKRTIPPCLVGYLVMLLTVSVLF